MNSDDPAYFDGYLAANYDAAQRALGPHQRRHRRAGAQLHHGLVAPPERVCDLLAEIDAFVAAHPYD